MVPSGLIVPKPHHAPSFPLSIPMHLHDPVVDLLPIELHPGGESKDQVVDGLVANDSLLPLLIPHHHLIISRILRHPPLPIVPVPDMQCKKGLGEKIRLGGVPRVRGEAEDELEVDRIFGGRFPFKAGDVGVRLGEGKKGRMGWEEGREVEGRGDGSGGKRGWKRGE